MKRARPLLVLLLLAAAAGGAYYYLTRLPSTLMLTGIVTTNDVIVSPQIAGQIAQLLVKEGDAVKKGQLVAVIRPDELLADSDFYMHSAAGLGSQVRESEAALRFQERQTGDQIKQLASISSGHHQSRRAANRLSHKIGSLWDHGINHT